MIIYRINSINEREVETNAQEEAES
jgi:hypothetical protein